MLGKVIIYTIEDGIIVARKIVEMLDGMKFDVVSCHSAHQADMMVLEEVSLASLSLVVSDGLIKIPLKPRRNLCFDIKDKPLVIFESYRQIRIVRNFARDTLTRIILVN